MRYEHVKNLSSPQFKRLVGVRHQTFRLMVEVMRTQTPPKLKSGRPSKLSLEDQVLVTLHYWREYRTYFHIAQTWGVSEATVCRIVHHVENTLIRSGGFRLPGKKWLLQGHEVPATVVVDVTETPIERPKHKQKQFYSGKKKRHTLKSQLVVDQQSRTIICTAYGKGRRHDFWLFQVSGVRLHPRTLGLGDKGYQGWSKLHENLHIPTKKPKGEPLPKREKRSNRELAQRRVVAEHVNRHLKIFRILSERYRNRRRRFGLRCNLIAALYNSELGLAG